MSEEEKEFERDMEKVGALRALGHTHHCACRITWGDGECECSMGNIRLGGEEGNSEAMTRMLKTGFYLT